MVVPSKIQCIGPQFELQETSVPMHSRFVHMVLGTIGPHGVHGMAAHSGHLHRLGNELKLPSMWLIEFWLWLCFRQTEIALHATCLQNSYGTGRYHMDYV